MAGGLLVLAVVIVPHLLASPPPPASPQLANAHHPSSDPDKLHPPGGGAAGHVAGGQGAVEDAVVEPAGKHGGQAQSKDAGLLHKWTHAEGAPSDRARGQGASQGGVEKGEMGKRATAPQVSAGEKQRQDTKALRDRLHKGDTKKLLDGLRKGALLTPKQGTTAWERRQDDRFFDRMDQKRVPGQERQIKDANQESSNTEAERAQARRTEANKVRSDTVSTKQQDAAANICTRIRCGTTR
ncbi:hypothetical protein T484DRAFT_1850672 [Baffinella frigidus]|nr:hypothetical protein T484DRAFT_1850672 [Cryptophyta sp. CCMP2293]